MSTKEEVIDWATKLEEQKLHMIVARDLDMKLSRSQYDRLIEVLLEVSKGLSSISGQVGHSRKKEGISFPMEYKGWRIEIKMGHEFGRRGAVANYRGYVATRLSDGKTHNLMPSSAGPASLSGAKAIIDIEEGG